MWQGATSRKIHYNEQAWSKEVSQATRGLCKQTERHWHTAPHSTVQHRGSAPSRARSATVQEWHKAKCSRNKADLLRSRHTVVGPARQGHTWGCNICLSPSFVPENNWVTTQLSSCYISRGLSPYFFLTKLNLGSKCSSTNAGCFILNLNTNWAFALLQEVGQYGSQLSI
jgi:hypothetical protein